MEEKIIELRLKGFGMSKISKILKCSSSTVHKYCKKNGLSIPMIFDKSVSKYKHTEESKMRISESKKEFYRNNPDKHNWKSSNKLISKPCEEFKKVLDELGVKYVSEFTPLSDRFYSIDISFPERKIGIEINGNQHYNKNGALNTYYQIRHDLIENDGWKLHEIHFSVCFNRELVMSIINKIDINSNFLFDFNYKDYLIEKINKKKVESTCKCGNTKYKKSIVCITCSSLNNRKVDRPSYIQLLDDIETLGYRGTGRKYGVTDSAIKKWIKKYENEK